MPPQKKPAQALRTASFFSRVLTTSILVAPLLISAIEMRASAEFFLQQWEDAHRPARSLDVAAQIDYYSTQRNFDGNGSLQIPSELNKYSRVQTDIEAAWGLTRRLSVFGRSGWAYVEVEHSSRAGNAFGFTDQTLGANLRVYEGSPSVALAPTGIDLQIQVDFPAYDNARATEAGVPFLGDGSVDVTAGGFLSVPLAQSPSRSVLLTGGGGYTRRSSGFSAGIPWSITAEYLPTSAERAFGSIGLNGVYSLLTDSSRTDGSSRSSSATGGSFIVNAINPSIATIKGTIGYQLTRGLQGYVTASQSIAGQSAPSGFMAALGVRATIGPSPLGEISGSDHAQANRGFVNYALDAPVLRANDRLNLVKVGKGRQDGVEVGQIFDIFNKTKDSAATGELVARGRITAVRFEDADVSITEVFKEVWIEEGFLAKRLIQ